MKKIGDKVWIASLSNRVLNEICPDCLGTKRVILLLENGDRESLECQTCYPGRFMPSTGYLIKTQYQSSADQRIIDSMDIKPGKTTYRFYDRSCDDVFETEAEAIVAAEKLRVEAEDDAHMEFVWKKENSRRTWAWNCSYYRKQIKYAKQHIAWAQAKLQIASSKAKEPAAMEGVG